jgi:hypothetical protein
MEKSFVELLCKTLVLLGSNDRVEEAFENSLEEGLEELIKCQALLGDKVLNVYSLIPFRCIEFLKEAWNVQQEEMA